METCKYQDKVICSYELKDDYGYYEENMVLEWKQAAGKRKLSCTDCGEPVYLAAGVIKEPYFSHYDLKDCPYTSTQESEELLKGKRLLYQLLRRSFPEGTIHARYRMKNGLYSGLYCEGLDGSPIGIDMRLQNSSLEQFQLRNAHYQENQIVPIYVLGFRMNKKNRQNDWFGHLIQSTMGYIFYLNSMKEQVTLRKNFRYHLDYKREYEVLEKTYSIRDLKFNMDGSLNCDFIEECKKVEVRIEDTIRKYKEKKERLKELERERLTLIEKDNLRYLQYKNEIRMTELKDKIYQLVNDLHIPLLEKCKIMMEEGNGHLVSQKYYDVVLLMMELEGLEKENILSDKSTDG